MSILKYFFSYPQTDAICIFKSLILFQVSQSSYQTNDGLSSEPAQLVVR